MKLKLMETPSSRKMRGAYFTPREVSAFLVEWSVRSPSDHVLEPACGEASFLLAAAKRLSELGAARDFEVKQVRGVELHLPSARAAEKLLAEHGFSTRVEVSDFFDLSPAPDYDAVIGNPPYIRYQHFSGEARIKGLRAALAQSVRLNGLASSWAAFAVHAARFLRPGGRLALVLPAELLTVKYAAEVRGFLLRRFGQVRLVTFEELVFPGVLEEVVLLLAEGRGPSASFEVFQARDLEDLRSLNSAAWSEFAPEDGGKWTPSLISADAFAAYRNASTGPAFCPLLEWGETYLGAVTGNNDYFTLTASQVTAFGLRAADLLHISPPGSRHLRGLDFNPSTWANLIEEGRKCYLFAPDPSRPSRAALRYAELGESKGVHKAYKCRMRKPWWRVPVVSLSDLILTYMDSDHPRLVANTAGVHHLNSLYGVALRPGYKDLGRDLLPLASLNSVTLLGAEIVGRAYGGGMLKLEPKEADMLPVPSRALLRAAAKDLRRIRPAVQDALGKGDVVKAVQVVDQVLLAEHHKVSQRSIVALREARGALLSRRVSRGRSPRGED